MKIGLGVTLAFGLATASPVMATPADGFGVFWPAFQAAIAKNDAKALASMVALSPNLGDDGVSFAKFHAGELGPKVRRCLGKAKPDRDVDPNGDVHYSAFCGQVIYGFSKSGGAWKLTDLSPDD
jgi:hypothetical protein